MRTQPHPRRALLTAVAAPLSALSGLLLLLACSEAPQPPSILLVTLDTLRADRVSAYGYPLPTTPQLDALAARGTRFELALAPSSSTAPTHASIFTGLLPSFHSVGAHNSQFALEPTEITLAEQLAGAGYRTAAVVSNPLLGRALGLDQGFAHYDDATLGEGPFASKGRLARNAIDSALAWLEAHADTRFFFWLHLQDAHGPYATPDEFSCAIVGDGCFGACPEDAIVKLGPGRRYRFNYDRCTGCAVCAEQCPCHAIEMVAEPVAIPTGVAEK